MFSTTTSAPTVGSASDRSDAGWWLACLPNPARRKLGAVPAATAPLIGEPADAVPSCATVEGCGVIFDGFLYNRDELRELLGDVGDLAVDDAGLVLRAHRRWGDEVLQKIKGIYAVIIWDRDRELVLAARDRLGSHPLFYAEAGRDLIFSTSIDALLRHPDTPGEVNRVALAEHLCHRWPRKDETYFAAVKRVPPGHALRVSRVGLQVDRYWDPSPLGEPIDWITEDVQDRFDHLFDQAVNRCLGLGRAGIFLSGGFDSISIAAMAADNARRAGRPVPWALSLLFPDPLCNEEVVQRSVAQNLRLPQELLAFGEAVGPEGLLLPAMRISRDWPTPLLNTWMPAYAPLALQGKRYGCRVILTGSGGDEWLTVSPYLAADLLRSFNIAGLCSFLGTYQRSYRGPRWRMVRGAFWTFGLRPLLAAAAETLAPQYVQARRSRRLVASTPAWLAPDRDLRREVDRRADESLQPLRPAGGFYVHEMRTALDHPLMAGELEEVFEMGRRMGFRVLHPYWDHDLVDMLYRTPPRLLCQGGRSKSLVRETLARRFPGLGFEHHKKVGGGTFYKSTLLREGPIAWQTLGGARALAALGIVNPTAVEEFMGGLFSRSLPQTHRIWDMLNLESWVRPRI